MRAASQDVLASASTWQQATRFSVFPFQYAPDLTWPRLLTVAFQVSSNALFAAFAPHRKPPQRHGPRIPGGLNFGLSNCRGVTSSITVLPIFFSCSLSSSSSSLSLNMPSLGNEDDALLLECVNTFIDKADNQILHNATAKNAEEVHALRESVTALQGRMHKLEQEKAEFHTFTEKQRTQNEKLQVTVGKLQSTNLEIHEALAKSESAKDELQASYAELQAKYEELGGNQKRLDGNHDQLNSTTKKYLGDIQQLQGVIQDLRSRVGQISNDKDMMLTLQGHVTQVVVRQEELQEAFEEVANMLHSARSTISPDFLLITVPYHAFSFTFG